MNQWMVKLDDAWLHERVENEEEDDNEWLYQKINDARKNVKNCAGISAGSAGRRNGLNGAGTYYGNARDDYAKSSNEGSIDVVPASSYKNGNSTGNIHWDSDELVNLVSLYEDGNTITIPVYSLVGNQLELSIRMKVSNQVAFREYLVDYALKGGYNIRFIKSVSWKVTLVMKKAALGECML
ncbi:hypothetical protein FEM48_Zijuj03G0082900 [Ziziphus jujuba var. spinosa]|uniref:Uncharacterized protein n=1 Tax=Ziziphus jujuba var. spinosa TaxID=714518 RepID=A0A978VP72_ZIZJJ|nr:hypothetical protein FEM48_Zijuj03G0082900 [Ziziphus jujuba var. spinosa]